VLSVVIQSSPPWRLTIDPEVRRRVNPFEWQRAFPQVFAKGGQNSTVNIRLNELNLIYQTDRLRFMGIFQQIDF
jgi:hypothetical protein